MLRMVWIRNSYRERVIEDNLTLLKADAMFCLIACGLVFVPFEYEIHQYLFQCRTFVNRLIAVFVILHYDMRNRIRPQLRRLIRHMRVSISYLDRIYRILRIFCLS